MANDNWEHRHDNMKCKTCMSYVEKETKKRGTHLGRCRRHAPTLSGWPVMFAEDWCLDHKLDETKL